MKKFLLSIIFLTIHSTIYSQCVSNLVVNNVNSTGATLNWTINNPSVATINVKWRKLGCTTSWNTSNACVTSVNGLTGSSFLLDTLSANTEYEWRIKWFGCTPNSWTDGPNFITSPAPTTWPDTNIVGLNYLGSYNGSYYYEATNCGLGNTGYTWSQANSMCSNNGGHLVTIANQARM